MDWRSNLGLTQRGDAFGIHLTVVVDVAREQEEWNSRTYGNSAKPGTATLNQFIKHLLRVMLVRSSESSRSSQVQSSCDFFFPHGV